MATAASATVASATTYEIGPSRPYRTFAALPALGPGDVVQVDPGVYYEVVRWTGSGSPDAPIVIRGVGSSRPIIDGTGSNIDGRMPRPRAIFQIEGSHYVIDNLEFRNGRNTGANGAGIRIVDGVNVVIRNSRITYCDMGLMGNGYDQLVVESTEVALNGLPSPYVLAHNVYLADGGSARFSFCYIHDALSGQNFKTRGHYTELLYNHIADSNEGEVSLVDSVSTASPESHALLLGNVIISKPNRIGNAAKFIDFGQEVGGNHLGTLYLVNNTLVAGTGWIEFLSISATSASVEASNNIFHGSRRIAPGALGSVNGVDNWTTTGAAIPAGFIRTTSGGDPGFVNAGGRDFRLSLGAGARDAGVESVATRNGIGTTRWVRAESEYSDHLAFVSRPRDGVSDAGAYEYVDPASSVAQTLLATHVPVTQSYTEGVVYELGMRWRSTVAGQVTAVRFWKGATERGPHVGRIWSAAGALLAMVTFTSESGSGWQQQALTAPLPIAAHSDYIVSVTTDAAGYLVVTTNGFASGVVNGPLQAPPGSGRWLASGGGFPANSNHNNFYRDVVFVAASTPAPSPPAPGIQTLLTTEVPVTQNYTEGVVYELGMRWRSTMAGQVTALRFWKGASEMGPHVGRLWSATGALLATVSFTSETGAGWQQQALATPVAIAADTDYIVSVTTDAAGYLVVTTNGFASGVVNGPLQAPPGSGRWSTSGGGFPANSNHNNFFRDVVFVAASTPAPSPPAPGIQTLLTTEVPVTQNYTEGVVYELGMRWRSTVAGQVTALRFWKGASEMGPHVGRLWSATGALLATVSFTSETGAGWQQQALATPVAIAADTDYIVSVTTDAAGYLVVATNGFASGVVNGPLQALSGSGRWSATGGQFPANTNHNSFFRDVVFVAAATVP